MTGRAWLDHEWSSTLLAADASGWDWLGANLDDGSALMAFKVRGRNGRALWAHAALRDRDGHMAQYGPGEVELSPHAAGAHRARTRPTRSRCALKREC